MSQDLSLLAGTSYLLVSYMRSGSIWLRSLLYDYDALLQGNEITPERPPQLGRYSPQLGLRNFVEKYSEGRERFNKQIIKTHWSYDRLGAAAADKKILLLFRKPADALVSGYQKRTTQNYQPKKRDPGDWSVLQKEMQEVGLDETCLSWVDTWKAHTTSFLTARLTDGALGFVAYESLKADPVAGLSAVARFFDYEHDLNKLKQAVDNRDFARMKSTAQSTYANININKGEVGGSATKLKPETLAEIEAQTNTLYADLLAAQKQTLDLP